VHDFPRWDKQQRLLHYKPANYSDINLAIKHIDGAYLPVNYSASSPPMSTTPMHTGTNTRVAVFRPIWPFLL
jgi:hypothetical protein